MAKKKDNKVIFIIIALIGLFLIYNYTTIIPTSIKQPIQNKINYFTSGGSGSPMPVVNKGVGLKVTIVDENGNVQRDLIGPNTNTFSIISASSPSGFLSLSNAICVSSLSACTSTSQCPLGQTCSSSQCKCSFLAISSQFDNTLGNSDISVNSASATITCSSGNSDSNCASVPNAFGLSSVANTKRGNMNSKFSFPISITKGTSSSNYTSDPISLDEIASTLTTNGLVDFKISADGTYRDAQGNDQPFTNKLGYFTIRVARSTCVDNTPADYDVSDTDESKYCSIAQKGKYCKINTRTGYPVYTDRASICGCSTGQIVVGEICKASACTPNTCIAGTVNYCLADGKSFETRCQQCGVNNCPIDFYGASSTSCSPATSGVISQCVYPAVGASGLSLELFAPTIGTVIPCGDEVKNDAEEQCDTYDFGGESCTSVGSFSGGILSCTVSCTYNTSQCISNYVKFRTIFSAINTGSNSDGIAFNTGYASSCNSGPLTKAGESTTSGTNSVSATCASYMASLGYTKLFNITNGITTLTRGSFIADSEFGLWNKISGEYAVAGRVTSSGKCVYEIFKTSIATSISDSANSIDNTKETLC